MPNYQNGKIYSIRSYLRPDLVYIGSTVQSLAVRFGGHKSKSNTCSSKEIVALGDAYIELIEEYPCENRIQLAKMKPKSIS